MEAVHAIPVEFEVPIEIKEAAQLLGVSVPNLRKMCERDEVPHFRMGWKFKFRKSSLDRWVNKQIDSRTAGKNKAAR
jgi:excisionase family DNA binding protein